MNDLSGYICDECGKHVVSEELPAGWEKIGVDYGPALDVCPACIAAMDYEDDLVDDDDDFEQTAWPEPDIVPYPHYLSDDLSGFDGLGLCPGCHGVETRGAKLCVSCQRQKMEDEH